MLFRLLSHGYYLSLATAWLLMAFGQSARYFRGKALTDLAIPAQKQLNSKEKRRLKHYFYGTTYLSILFGILRGRTRSPQEKHLFTNLAALAYFFDDLSDSFRKKDDNTTWQDNPEAYGEAADDRRLSLHFLENIYASLPAEHTDEFKTYMHRVFNVETTGRQASAEVPTFEELERITREKGGCSVLLFRRVLRDTISASEVELWMEFGGFIQLCDDIFDLYFDHQEGTHTLVSIFFQEKNMAGLHAYFEKKVSDLWTSFRNTNFPTRQQESAIRASHYLVAVTRVCIAHYRDLEQTHGKLPVTDRHTMVVDMEKWKNRLRGALALVRPV